MAQRNRLKVPQIRSVDRDKIRIPILHPLGEIGIDDIRGVAQFAMQRKGNVRVGAGIRKQSAFVMRLHFDPISLPRPGNHPIFLASQRKQIVRARRQRGAPRM